MHSIIKKRGIKYRESPEQRRNVWEDNKGEVDNKERTQNRETERQQEKTHNTKTREGTRYVKNNEQKGVLSETARFARDKRRVCVQKSRTTSSSPQNIAFL